jgi:hypothetical protein
MDSHGQLVEDASIGWDNAFKNALEKHKSTAHLVSLISIQLYDTNRSNLLHVVNFSALFSLGAPAMIFSGRTKRGLQTS